MNVAVGWGKKKKSKDGYKYAGQVRSGQERKEGNVLFNDALNTF